MDGGNFSNLDYASIGGSWGLLGFGFKFVLETMIDVNKETVLLVVKHYTFF